jgi:hypothetical protein
VIVREDGDHLLLIRQPDHARLSRRIMERCVALAAHPRREVILHAIEQHDNGWSEEDAAPAVDETTGRILDFVNAPSAVRHRVWPRGVARLREAPYAAALVAQHAITVYDRFRREPAWEPFFAGMQAAREEMLQASGLRQAEIDADYPLVRLGDLISLTFCTGWTDVQRYGGWTVQRAEARVTVTPDSFGGLCVPLTITARRVTNRRFTSIADLRDELASAEMIELQGEFR